MKDVDLYLKVRHAVRIEGLSERAAARRFGIDPRTVNKMMKFSAFDQLRYPHPTGDAMKRGALKQVAMPLRVTSTGYRRLGRLRRGCGWGCRLRFAACAGLH
jgi:hypothetical protein